MARLTASARFESCRPNENDRQIVISNPTSDTRLPRAYDEFRARKDASNRRAGGDPADFDPRSHGRVSADKSRAVASREEDENNFCERARKREKKKIPFMNARGNTTAHNIIRLIYINAEKKKRPINYLHTHTHTHET